MKPEYQDLKNVCDRIRAFGSRYRHDVAHKLRQALRAEELPAVGNRLVRCMLGVTISQWVSASEALAKMREHGVEKNRKFLYRVARKAALSSEMWIAVYLDKDGNSGPLTELIAPKIKLEVKVSKVQNKRRMKCRIHALNSDEQ